MQSGAAHLLPSFGALEAGSSPNLADIQRYLAAGLQPRYVHDYRRHAPPSPPPSPPPPPQDEAGLPPLEVEVYGALAQQSPALAVRQLAARLRAGAVRMRAQDAAVFTRLADADPSGLAAHRYLAARLPPAAHPPSPKPTLNPQAPEFRLPHY